MDLLEVRCRGVEWIVLAQDRGMFVALANEEMN